MAQEVTRHSAPAATALAMISFTRGVTTSARAAER